ncbi:ATP-dependent helicase C-terminal domain-containing protein [Dactylosporangium sp. NPDC049742]|uniref:ATP-dependent RNA helicase n=1 Tax=Dactylosporangium sp. NPDC049742 TaxID=3154737 RepID=UPI003415B43D
MGELAVERVLGDVVSVLGGGAGVLVAPPGSGKTTLVPGVLAGAFEGRVVVAEPRRIAARAAARRMAELRGERVGQSVGYSVRGDRRVGPGTRVEVVTTGLLVQRLLADPELAGVGTVMIDECHERHLDTDLALGFLVESRQTLRPELRLLATSATADTQRLAELLEAGIVAAEGSPHEVAVVWCPPERPVRPPHGLKVDPVFLDHVAAVVRRAWRETAGDLLVFLPGAAEIASVRGRLADLPTDVLHGRLPAAAQDAAIRAGDRRRVVLATAVAESSLTVPGVRVVVDAGLARVPRTDHARGLGSLATVRAAKASTVQRAGRAGREGPGVVYRCWSQLDDERLPAQPEPEVAVAELSAFALALACWGHPGGVGLALPDAPPDAAMRVAQETLRALGAVDDAGRATPRGHRMSRVGAHPRLARALLDGAPAVGARKAAEVVAILADDTLARGDDLAAAWRHLRDARDPRWRAEADRLQRSATPDAQQPATDAPPRAAADAPPRAAATDALQRAAVDDQQRDVAEDQQRAAAGDRQPAAHAGDRQRANQDGGRRRAAGGGGAAPATMPDDLVAGLIVGLAYPERLARLRGGAYLMAGGTEAALAQGSALTGHPWLAVAVADRQPGNASARVRLAAAIDEDTAREAGAALLSTVDEVTAEGAERQERLGAITLRRRELKDPPRELVERALREALAKQGLRWTKEAAQLRQRMDFCHRVLGPPWPDVSDAAVIMHTDLSRVTKLSAVDPGTTLRAMLPWPAAARLDELAPERLPVPSGSLVRLDYSDPEAPVLAVKVQEAFGWLETPRIGDGRVAVLLHLLSPAGRPTAVTRDLASFWRTGYPQVRAELRGRYPRHPWPEDPATAVPTRRTNPRK